jgi:hypothetical protein
MENLMKITFNQRIELGKLYGMNIPDFEKYEKVFVLLQGREPQEADLKGWTEYLWNTAVSFSYWMKQETLLRSESTINKQSVPGQKEYSVTDTINALAKKYSVKPEEVLNWDYEKVFNILLTDLENYKRELNISECN